MVLSPDHMGGSGEESDDRAEKRLGQNPGHQAALLLSECRAGSVSLPSSPLRVGVLINFLEGMLQTSLQRVFVSVS